MKENILIVEDEFIVANDLRIMLQKADYRVCGIAPSVAKALELIKVKSPDWILLDIILQGSKTGIDLASQLVDMKIPFIYISANTNQAILEAAKATQPYGFLVKPFREKDLMVMLDIAQYRHAQSLKFSEVEKPSFNDQIQSIIDKGGKRLLKIQEVAETLQSVLTFDFLSITRLDAAGSDEDLYIVKDDQNSLNVLTLDDVLETLGVSQRDFRSFKPFGKESIANKSYANVEFRRLKMDSLWLKVLSDKLKHESAVMTDVASKNRYHYRFCFLSKSSDYYQQQTVDLLAQNEQALGMILNDMVLGKDSVETVHRESKSETPTKQQQVASSNFHGIIGQSPLLKTLFHKIELVAPDDTSVLILGESGTGKERIAHTIHKLSPRKSKPIVTVNCAALPITLIESELFGHEKGAFTGANDRRIGKFEQADGGTIFLDEIGELTLEAQVKLLRVLQEREIERLGGSQTKKINVRVITATNRNLEKEVAEGRFRLDLYYRLNVFPIELPPLRRRKEDIPLLANYFMSKYSLKSKRNIQQISDAAMEELVEYNWPGNIRELEHLIERSVLMTSGSVIEDVEIPEINASLKEDTEEPGKIKTMEQMERDHIIAILKMCNGKVFGPGGAAEILNLPSTTLNSKIKKLGIKFEFVK